MQLIVQLNSVHSEFRSNFQYATTMAALQTNDKNNNVTIRKIHIHPVKPWVNVSNHFFFSNISPELMSSILLLFFFDQLEKQVRHYFVQFGPIESIEFDAQKSFAFLQFKTSNAASAAIGKQQHTINGKKVAVKAAHVKHQPKDDHLMLNASASTDQWRPKSSLILHRLNDHCILEIFKFLPLRDLCAVADVYTSFRKNAKTAFSHRFANINDEMIINVNHKETQLKWKGRDQMVQSRKTMKILLSLFRNFGQLMKSIDLHQEKFGKKQNNLPLELMASNCSGTGSALRALKLNKFSLKGHLIQKLQPVFAQLDDLQMESISINRNISKLFSVCQQLTKLKLESMNFDKIHLNPFTKLTEVVLCNIRGLNDDVFEQFACEHSQITKLDLNSMPHQLSTNVFNAIGSHLLSLKELCIHDRLKKSTGNVQEYLSRLTLKHLKCLKLNCSSLPVKYLFDALVSAQAPIEYLDLINITLDSETATSLSKMNTIEHLRLANGIFGNVNGELVKAIGGMAMLTVIEWYQRKIEIYEIKNIIQVSTKLTTLKLFNVYGLNISSKDYIDIVESVKGRENYQPLNIEIIGKSCQKTMADGLIEQNSDWVTISVENYICEMCGEHCFDSESEDDKSDEVDVDDSDSEGSEGSEGSEEEYMGFNMFNMFDMFMYRLVFSAYHDDLD